MNSDGGNLRNRIQRGILQRPPPAARHLTFSLRRGANARAGLRAVRELADGERIVAGLGQPLARALGVRIRGLRAFPLGDRPGAAVPSTPRALWLWLRGAAPGELFHRSRTVEQVLDRSFRLNETVDAFTHDGGRDLTGYEDGTENPKGAKAVRAAFARGTGPLAGSSYAAVQRWEHRFAQFDAMTPRGRDLAVGRRLRGNAEIADAPDSAHVKRTAQETFDPPAFVVRRSMAWTAGTRAGLMFVAFGGSLDAFEALLRRMTGAEDGIVDALFRFTHPVSGGYFWCPPMVRGKLDLRALGVPPT